jgi:hypothetical protein
LLLLLTELKKSSKKGLYVKQIEDDKLVLKFSHNIIEHLGLKLYQNKPTNVIAELVSNGWDACAKNVYIDIDYTAKTPYISIIDDGIGMTIETLRDSYLTIGKLKREDKTACINCSDLPERKPMGRKGIGKLAPFGIAKEVHILTVAIGSDNKKRANWIAMNIEAILSEPSNTDQVAAYVPDVPIKNQEFNPDEIQKVADEYEFNEPVKKFLLNITTGTVILLKNFSIVKEIDPKNLIESMGRRFTVTLLRDDFNVHVGKTQITEKNALPEFDYRIPEAQGEWETVIIDNKEVKYWVGFVQHADWPQDEAGVGVYAHGKIAQDRPFTFGDKGNEITTRYMYAVVSADWLDELKVDVVSTDRTSIDWQLAETQSLYKWGNEKVGKWVREYRAYKKEKNKDKISEEIAKKTKEKIIPKVTEAEQSLMKDMLSDIYLDIGKNEATKEKLLIATANAWTHRPMKDMIKKLWDSMRKKDLTGEEFTEILEKLNDYAVPEALSLSVTFAQRAYALNLLYGLMHKGREVDMQKLIESFPWILKPDMEMLTANRTLKSVVEEACKQGLSPSRFQHEISSNIGVDNGKQPDFVFLSNGAETSICIIELKHPSQEITLENREQLGSYMTYIESKYPEAKRTGILIGNNTKKISNNDKEHVEFLTWDEVYRKSRLIHIEFLSSMIKSSASELDDSRIKDIQHFGGKETIEILKKISANSLEMSELAEEFKDLETIGRINQ